MSNSPAPYLALTVCVLFLTAAEWPAARPARDEAAMHQPGAPPPANAAAVLVGAITLEAVNYGVFGGSTVNGAHSDGIVLTLSDLGTGQVTVTRSEGKDGVFYFPVEVGHRYQLTKVHFRVDHPPSWAEVWNTNGATSIFINSVKEGVNDLGRLDWRADKNVQSNRLNLVQDFQGVQDRFKAAYPRSDWISAAWTDVSQVQAGGRTTLALWDFLTGGDGARWKAIVNDFNTGQNDFFVSETTAGGDAFYSKVHAAVAAGNAPDVMTYHLSHFPAGIQGADLRALSEDDLKTASLSFSDFNPVLVRASLEISKMYGTEGVLYGVPLDLHTVVLYYNRDILGNAGQIGPDWKLLQPDFTGIANFTRSLEKIKATTGALPIAMSTSFPPSIWRMWSTLFYQQGGSLTHGSSVALDQMDTLGRRALQVMTDWASRDLMSTNPSYSENAGAIATFSSGKAAFLFDGDWEVPTYVDLEKAGKLPFKFGVMSFPRLFDSQETWADSHNLVIPNGQRSDASLRSALTFIAFVEKNADKWAASGHLPAYLPVLYGPVLAQLSPMNQYAVQAALDARLEPPNPIFGAGAQTYKAVDSFLSPALNGGLSIDDAIAKFRAELDNLSM
jgi:multiple sugar transport system substrate-binding protein